MTTVIGSVLTQSLTLKPASGIERTAVSAATTDAAFTLTRKEDANFNQRLVVDPQAGVITEFLTSRGDIQAQIPSTVVVAYLRAGLTADGLTREQAAKVENTTSA